MYPLGGGVRGDPVNSVLARIGGELAVSVSTPIFFFFFRRLVTEYK